MAKRKTKLSVKKETLRVLGGEELRRVAGAYELLYANKLAIIEQPILLDPYKLDSSDVCQSGLVGGGSLSCVRVQTRCYEP